MDTQTAVAGTDYDLRDRMRVLAIVLLTAAASAPAHAEEGRVRAGWGFGHSVISDSVGDELSFDQRALGLGGTYFFEPGIYLGASFERGKVKNIQFNGQDLGVGSFDVKGRAFTLGFRTGTRGTARFRLSVSALNTDVEGESSDATQLGIGVERDFEKSRVEITGHYTDGDGEQSAGMDVTGVFFVDEQIGLFLTGGYSVGTIDLGSEDGDTLGLVLAAGVELRFLGNQ